MSDWAPGYSATLLTEFQEKYGLKFPPDLIELYLERRPAKGLDWRNEEQVRDRLGWPLEGILFDVRNEVWWPHWGERPVGMAEREKRVRDLVAQAPKLIPILSHRYLPESPSERGNPVFSVYGTDIIYYGVNLDNYFQCEFKGGAIPPEISAFKHIPFWSDFTESDAL